MGFLLNGVQSEGLPENIVKVFTDAYVVPFFVETGTAGGDSIKVASRLFQKCYTIELIEGRVLDKSLPNVEYFTGDSVKYLLEIMTNFTGQYVFVFLDAHFSDSVPNTSGYKECPVLEELKVIAAYQKVIILIDDARLFFGHPPYPNDPREWPKIEEIFAATKVLFPNHHTTIVDDYVLCYPDELGGAVISEWTRRFNIRYPSALDKLKTQVKGVWDAFLKTYVNV
jgi:hypothetical protein